jgi:glycine oxidase
VGYARAGTIEVFLRPEGEAERDSRVGECRRLGIAAEGISVSEARHLEDSIGTSAQAAMWLPEEGTVEPRSLMDALLESARRTGVEIRSSCPVTGALRSGDRCIGVVAGGEEIAAGWVVLAAGCFSGEVRGEAHAFAAWAPTRPVRGQMVALRPSGRGLQCVLRSKRGYLVPRRDGRIVAGSTLEDAGFEKRVTAAGVREILNAAIEICPALACAELLETWSGLRPGTPDDLPIIGPTDVEGLLIATGHYRNGILLAPITARLVREWITSGHAALDVRAFSPLRFNHREVKSLSRGT